MQNEAVCEVCGKVGVPEAEPASCWTPVSAVRETPNPDEIITFQMNRMYSLKVCRACREKLSIEDLRNKVREKVRKASQKSSRN